MRWILLLFVAAAFVLPAPLAAKGDKQQSSKRKTAAQDDVARTALRDFRDAVRADAPRLEEALAICQSGHLAPGSAQSIRLDAGTNVGDSPNLPMNKSTTKSSIWPMASLLLGIMYQRSEAIGVLSCLVESDAIDVRRIEDRGAELLWHAASRKHMRLTAALLKRGAPLVHREEGSMFSNVLHAAVSDELLLLDTVTNLLRTRYSRTAPPTPDETLDHISRSRYQSGFDQGLEYTRNMARMAMSMVKHLPAADAQRLLPSLQRLLAPSDAVSVTDEGDVVPRPGVDQAADSTQILRTVETKYTQTISYGLPILLLRLLLDDKSRSSEVITLLASPDRIGRTPLHVAASSGNIAAVKLLLRAMATQGGSAPGNDENGRQRVVEYVLQRDIGNLTAVDLACVYGYGPSDAIGIPSSSPGDDGYDAMFDVATPMAAAAGIDIDSGDVCAAAKVAGYKAARLAAAGSSSSSTADATALSTKGGDGGWREGQVKPHGLGAQALEITKRIVQQVRAAESGPNSNSNSSRANVDSAQPRYRCGVDVLTPAEATPAVFFRDFYLRNRPVIIRGLASDWPQRDAWSREALVQNFGSLAFIAGEIPYAKAYGMKVDGGDASSWASTSSAIHKQEEADETAAAAGAPVAVSGAAATTKATPKPRSTGGVASSVLTIREYVGTMFSRQRVPRGEAGEIAPGADGGSGGDDVQGDRGVPLYIFDSPVSQARNKASRAADGEYDDAGAGASQVQPSAPMASSARGLSLKTGTPDALTAANRRGRKAALSASGDDDGAVAATVDVLLAEVNLIPPFLRHKFAGHPNASAAVFNSTSSFQMVYVHDPSLSPQQQQEQQQSTLQVLGEDGVDAARPGARERCKTGDICPTSSSNDGARPAAAEEEGELIDLVQINPPPKAQFYLGPPGSGAPVHIHKDAWNAMMYGHKTWFLMPPAHSIYSTVPIAEWIVAELNDDGDASKHGSQHPSWRSHMRVCEQHAGDVMYVPHGWGHGVLNMENSIGVAVEFSAATAYTGWMGS